MFIVENEEYELRFNHQKIETLEKNYMNGRSFMETLISTNAMLPLGVLKALYLLGLYNLKTEMNITGKKAEEVYQTLLQEHGYAKLSGAAVLKIQEDMGFLFQGD